ncbi:MAG: hypothetical protein OXD44_11995 [Gammaproteobacteria bacterium]|nr:hypothetical protein [Gammaproteobacteria bacterium]
MSDQGISGYLTYAELGLDPSIDQVISLWRWARKSSLDATSIRFSAA